MLNDYINRLSFRRRIRYGYLILFVLICIIIIVSVFQIRKIASDAEILFEHPFVVSNAISEINSDINKTHALINRIIFEEDHNENEKYIARIHNNEMAIGRNYDTIALYFLGDRRLVVKAKKSFTELNALNNRIIEMDMKGAYRDASVKLATDASVKVSELIENNRPIKTYAINKANELIAGVQQREKWSMTVIIGLILLIAVLGFVIVIFIEKSITIPIRRFTMKARELLKLKLTLDDKNVSEQDVLDITLEEVRRHYRELEKLVFDRTEALTLTIDKLERSNKDLEQFAYVASHDLQEPLRMISSYTQLLERRYKNKLDQDAQDFIHFAVDGANRMQKLINDLLDFSRISIHDASFRLVDTHEVLGHVVSNLQHLISSSNTIITNEDLPTVYGNDSELLQLFQNLVENGIKFRKKTEIPIIHISCETKDDVYEFSFRDNGIGIDMQYHDRVFIIFQRLHSREKYSGTGIGLPICKKIVEKHGGKIWFESATDLGTTFKFTINKYQDNNYGKHETN